MSPIQLRIQPEWNMALVIFQSSHSELEPVQCFFFQLNRGLQIIYGERILLIGKQEHRQVSWSLSLHFRLAWPTGVILQILLCVLLQDSYLHSTLSSCSILGFPFYTTISVSLRIMHVCFPLMPNAILSLSTMSSQIFGTNEYFLVMLQYGIQMAGILGFSLLKIYQWKSPNVTYA